MFAAQPVSSRTQNHRSTPEFAAPAKPLSKVQVWPRPNYLALLQRGHHPVNIMVLRILYAALPTKTKAKFQGAQGRLMDAIASVRDASLEWLEHAAEPQSLRLTKATLQEAMTSILARAFGPTTAGDPCYFTRRHVIDKVGCMLYALLADGPPHRLLPTVAKLDLANVELARSWPKPPMPWERRGLFIVGKGQVTVETRHGATFARWPASTATDKGVFQTFDDPDDARDWQESLHPVLVLTDKPTTRLLATHADLASAEAALA